MSLISIFYSPTITAIFANSSGPKSNMIGLLLACFGISKVCQKEFFGIQKLTTQNETDYPTEPSISPYSERTGPEPSMVYRHTTSGHAICKELKGKVTKVRAIHYEENCLNKANLLVEAEYKGEVTIGWFRYEEIQRHDGIRQAVETFRPQWR
jgi:hypothetical protein